MKFSKILIITSSGGGGLLQTANAKEQEHVLKNPELAIVKIDLLKDWIWKPLGRYFINFWNKAQKKGDVKAQRFCANGQFWLDVFFHPIFFCFAVRTIIKENIDHIIDTQVLATSAIVKAARILNWLRKKQVKVEKVLVDLPTSQATHFFGPIKRMSDTNRNLIILTTIQPLLKEGENEEAFWRKNCNLRLDQIQYEDVYVRQAFLKYKKKARSEKPIDILIRTKNNEEKKLIKECSGKGWIVLIEKENEMVFALDPEVHMITLLLGSQPAKNGTLNYVKKWIELAPNFTQKTVLFVFCADHELNQNSLFKLVSEYVTSIKKYPKMLSIVPFSFQKEDVIAALFHRSNVTCTRSGGQTAMELMCVSTGEMWIHSEAKGENPTTEELLNGILGWESASALYLQKVKGAKIVTPETFVKCHKCNLQEGATGGS